jgi:nucleoredoxin
MRARLFLCLLALAMPALHASEPPRTWTSKDGSAKLTATFFKTDGDKVVLILPNGRSQIIEKRFLSDADLAWIDEHGAGTSTIGAATVGADKSAKIPAALAGKLIDIRGRPADIAHDGRAPKYYIFYYSASWCGPCHAFTPQLVQFHRRMRARKADFEVVLVPSDRSQEDEVAYMKEMRMPWPGVAYDQRGASGIPNSTWGYIPAMVLVDADGNRLLEVNDSLSRDEFLKKAEKILQSGSQAAPN